MLHRSLFALGALALSTSLLGACAATDPGETSDERGIDTQESSLSPSQRRARAELIQQVARDNGILNAVLVAGVADAETRLSQCWSELTWACKGPYSADCGGPVVAGAGDGPCSKKQGGLGMFQFDAGDFDDTIAREGKRVLTLSGNIQAGVEFMIDMVVKSTFIGGVSTEAEAIAWMNGAAVGTAAYDTWIQTVTAYYNGCFPGQCSVYADRFDHYDAATRDIHAEMGEAFWRAQAPIEVYWARQTDGHYELRALAGASVTLAEYRVDGYVLAKVGRDAPETAEVETNFPATYTFTSETSERFFEVIGYDGGGARVAHGVGLIDVTPGTAVFIRQMGASLYEIGLERAPDEVAFLEVRADGHLLTDAVTGLAQSPRAAVRATFSQLGARSFTLSTFNADGSHRGDLHRTFDLE